MIFLRCIKGHNPGHEYRFETESITMGRGADCDLQIESSVCSRHHAKLEKTADGFFLVDLDSTNGVQLNGRKIRKAPIAPGDLFSIAYQTFQLVTGQEHDTDGSGAQIVGRVRVDDEERLLGNLQSIESLDSLDHDTGTGSGTSTKRSAVSRSAYRELARTHQALHTAFRVSQAISSTLEIDELYTSIVERIADHFTNADRACLFLREPDATLRLVRTVRRKGDDDRPVSRSILRRVGEERSGLLASDAVHDDRFAESASVFLSETRSMMCSPLLTPTRFLGVLYLDSSSVAGCFTTTELELLTLLGNQVAFAVENAMLYQSVQVSFLETVRSLSNALEAKDPYTRGHSDRVAVMAAGIARELGLEESRLRLLRTAAELHDIGKIAIHESIIAKTGRLDPHEIAEMRKHPELGVEILQPIHFLEPALPFVLHHHERFDGSGYPAGLKGEATPLEARIINIADAFDAMTTQRSYNNPMSLEDARAQCESESGKTFDADLVLALGRYLDKLAEAALMEDTNHATSG